MGKKQIPFPNPHPDGVWTLVSNTFCWGGGKGPPEISQTAGPISKFQTPFDSPVRELPLQGQKFDLEVTDDVTGQVKVRIFDFSGWVNQVKQKKGILSCDVFRSNFRIKPEKMTLKHFLKRQNRSKNKNSENHGKVPKRSGKVPVFDMFYVISQPFLKIST